MVAAREDLAAAQRHLDGLDEQMADLAGELASVVAAAHDAMQGKATAAGNSRSRHGLDGD
jgi:hypothetical protein